MTWQEAVDDRATTSGGDPFRGVSEVSISPRYPSPRERALAETAVVAWPQLSTDAAFNLDRATTDSRLVRVPYRPPELGGLRREQPTVRGMQVSRVFVAAVLGPVFLVVTLAGGVCAAGFASFDVGFSLYFAVLGLASGLGLTTLIRWSFEYVPLRRSAWRPFTRRI